MITLTDVTRTKLLTTEEINKDLDDALRKTEYQEKTGTKKHIVNKLLSMIGLYSAENKPGALTNMLGSEKEQLNGLTSKDFHHRYTYGKKTRR